MDALPRPFGPFLLLKSLGSGATGDVLLARPLEHDSNLPTPVVVKRMHRSLVSQPEQHARFHHEARIALALSTPHVPKIHIVGEAEGTSFIAMDFVAGWTLSRVIRGRKEHQQPVAVEALVDVVRGILNGLIALHEAIDPATGNPLDALHRDLAPKNIMLGEDGVTRLIDLGLGKSTVQDWQTMTGVIMGTPGYMAPEQVYASEVDLRADLYTVGVVLWELLSQESYIPRGPIHQMLREQAQAPYRRLPSRPGVPPALDDVLSQAMALAPADRFDSARAFLYALETATTGLRRSRGPVAELVTPTMWDELAADQDELLGLTQAIPVPIVPSSAGDSTTRMPAVRTNGARPSDGATAVTAPSPPVTAPSPPVTAPSPPVTAPSPPITARNEPTPSAFAPTVASPAIVVDEHFAPSAPTMPAVDRSASLPPPSVIALQSSDAEDRTEALVAVKRTQSAEEQAPMLMPKVAPAPTVPPVPAPPPAPKLGQTLAVGLAVVALGTALGIGSVVVYRMLIEEPAPAQLESNPAPPPAIDPMAGDRFDDLQRRAQALVGRVNVRGRARLTTLIEQMAKSSPEQASPAQLNEWEAVLESVARTVR